MAQMLTQSDLERNQCRGDLAIRQKLTDSSTKWSQEQHCVHQNQGFNVDKLVCASIEEQDTQTPNSREKRILDTAANHELNVDMKAPLQLFLDQDSLKSPWILCQHHEIYILPSDTTFSCWPILQQLPAAIKMTKT